MAVQPNATGKKPVFGDGSLTIPQFCRAENISIRAFYNLKDADLAPHIFYLGNSPRISPESRVAWRAMMDKRSTEKGSLSRRAAEARAARQPQAVE